MSARSRIAWAAAPAFLGLLASVYGTTAAAAGIPTPEVGIYTLNLYSGATILRKTTFRANIGATLIGEVHDARRIEVGPRSSPRNGPGVSQHRGRHMTNVTVNSTAALTKALASAHGGDVIALAPGTYSNVSIYKLNFSTPLTITSQDPKHPAVVAGLGVNLSSGLTFSQLQISPNGGLNTWSARVTGSSQISFSHVDLKGSSAIAPSDRASGLLVQASSQVTVSNSHFQYLNVGIAELNNDHVQISGNAVDLKCGITGGSTPCADRFCRTSPTRGYSQPAQRPRNS